ncbi:MAG: stage IV sporulation protein A [Clostridiales bacterium]|nr:stage IV sporulation protein A [Clostridiales bacterium]
MNQNLYRDIALRCDGDIYIGVVGPVRTGKSTFIKRFMELLVLPNITGEYRRERIVDELPVSGAGRTIMTTQPIFVPNEAAEITLRDQASIQVRLVDCAGYLIRGALGLNEGENARMVRTPWFDHDIPFEEAAEIGTRKVIAEHSTLGVVVTTDGSITDLPRSAYAEAEERVVRELKALGKPFVLVINTNQPGSEEAMQLQSTLAEKYGVTTALIDVEHMTIQDVNSLLESLLFEFPLSEIEVIVPKWVDALKPTHWLVESIMSSVKSASEKMQRVRDHAVLASALMELSDAESAQVEEMRLNEGALTYRLRLNDELFYRVLGEESGQPIEGEEHLFQLMTELIYAKREYDRVAGALASVRSTGYGMVSPIMSELTLEKPELVKQGSRFGVKLKASAPSLHLIRVDIQTEVSPIVGTEKQSEELVQYLLSEFENDPNKIWETDIFGKSLNDLVREGLSGKLMMMPEDVRQKMQEALQKIINEGNGGVICILL